MTVDAGSAQLLFLDHARMTGMAVEICVCPFQRKLETRQVIEVADFPDIVAVTVAAGRPQSADVFVIRLVAAVAVLRNGGLEIAAAVAIAATYARVLAQKRKAGFARVIEFL